MYDNRQKRCLKLVMIENFLSPTSLISPRLAYSLLPTSLSLYSLSTMPEVPKQPSLHPSSGHHLSKNWRALDFIEKVTSNPDAVQARVLSEILSRNAQVEYLGRHRFDGRTDRHSFKQLLPVISYEDIHHDVSRIANGDTSPILCSHPISEFLTSSGTSGGERKLMPTIEEELDRRSLLYSLLTPVISQFVPDLDKGKGMYFLFIKSEARTPGGLVARPVLTSYYNSNHFKNRLFDPYTNYTSPNATILCSDSYQSMYAQLLCGLCQRTEVLRVGAVFASGFIRAIRFLENHWPLLCHDIRSGTLSSDVTEPSVREAVAQILRQPDPALTAFIEAECRRSWAGIITRLWPNTKYVGVIVTCTMSQYIPTLDYYSGGLPLVCTTYGVMWPTHSSLPWHTSNSSRSTKTAAPAGSTAR
ncbi:hypothetical protein SAY86_029770 [Trapa natans]|uniref:Uncharacterized protein n=1 Tax=Trapa natans TaxID=22666 RepID=A0AAN7M470_TRANT|nr:hypothetical protein SAY86_029770 [Trapa natans]